MDLNIRKGIYYAINSKTPFFIYPLSFIHYHLPIIIYHLPMKLSLILPDPAYRELPDGGAVKGLLSLTSAGEAYFAPCPKDEEHTDTCFKQLAHGRVSISPACIRLEILLDRSETDCVPEDALHEECALAQDFVMAHKYDP